MKEYSIDGIFANPHRHSGDVKSGLCPECNRKQLKEKERRIVRYV